MKKIILFSALLTATLSFAQISVTPKSKDLEQVYKGGDKQLIQDVQDNFSAFNADYQVNGKFIITFDVDKDGKAKNYKVLPDVDQEFAYALIRSFKRVKNNFNSNMPKNHLAVLLDFNPKFNSDDGRERFTEPTMSNRSN